LGENAVKVIKYSLLYSKLQGIPFQQQLLCEILLPHTSPAKLEKFAGKINVFESPLS
jgi:hypothetical protein